MVTRVSGVVSVTRVWACEICWSALLLMSRGCVDTTCHDTCNLSKLCRRRADVCLICKAIPSAQNFYGGFRYADLACSGGRPDAKAVSIKVVTRESSLTENMLQLSYKRSPSERMACLQYEEGSCGSSTSIEIIKQCCHWA